MCTALAPKMLLDVKYFSDRVAARLFSFCIDFFPLLEENKSCTAVTTTDWGKPTGFLLVELALMNRNNFKK